MVTCDMEEFASLSVNSVRNSDDLVRRRDFAEIRSMGDGLLGTAASTEWNRFTPPNGFGPRRGLILKEIETFLYATFINYTKGTMLVHLGNCSDIILFYTCS